VRIKVTLFANDLIRLNFKYNLYIRNLIYTILPEGYSEFLHNVGFKYEKRNFKLFTFSKVYGKYFNERDKKFKDELVFDSEIHFYIASPITKILQYIASSMVKRESFKLGKNKLYLKSIEVYNIQSFDGDVTIKMLSPMTIRSTLYKKDGSRKTYYYTPYEEEFSRKMTENLRKKYYLVNGKLSDGNVEITPVKNDREKVILGDKDYVIKAWDGIYRLTGDPELISLSYDAGLGEKNSQGFGMWEVWRGKN